MADRYYRVFPIRHPDGRYGPDFQQQSFVAMSMAKRWPLNSDIKPWSDQIRSWIFNYLSGDFSVGGGRYSEIWISVVHKAPWPYDEDFAAAAWAAIGDTLDGKINFSYDIPHGGDVGAMLAHVRKETEMSNEEVINVSNGKILVAKNSNDEFEIGLQNKDGMPVGDLKLTRTDMANFLERALDEIQPVPSGANGGVHGGLGFFYVVGSGGDTLTYSEVCLSGTTAGGGATTPVRIADKAEANEIAAKLGGNWLVATTPWPSKPGIGPDVFYRH